ncbi:hypothetical protein LRS10_20045 [Phenylobacterium sp. J426]|nr:hypothetical protein [Phenylobacterium sp. J426]MCR5876234.1 hypothetical protein [Phenylobacterium sp. J426]
MSGAEGVLVLNIAVASLFAAAYAVIALTNPSQRVALAFTVSYMIGMLAPASDLLLGMSEASEALEWLSYSSFLVATLSISGALNLYRGRRPPWVLLALVLAVGLAGRAAIWNWPRDTLAYGAIYQAPFALAAVLAMRTVMIINRRSPMHLALAAVFGALALNFLTKPFWALAFGVGKSLRDYTDTAYALVSQASSGVLLLAAGLILLLIVTEEAIGLSVAASETDPPLGPRQSARLRARRRGGDRPRRPPRASGVRGGVRPRPLQAGERHPGARRRGRGDLRVRSGAASGLSRQRRRRPHGRRRVRAASGGRRSAGRSPRGRGGADSDCGGPWARLAANDDQRWRSPVVARGGPCRLIAAGRCGRLRGQDVRSKSHLPLGPA